MERALFWSGAVLVALITYQAVVQLFGAEARQWLVAAGVVVVVLSAPTLLFLARGGAGSPRWRRWREARRRAITHHRT